MAAFDKKFNDQEELVEIIEETTHLAGGFDIADVFPSIRLLQATSFLRRKLEKLHKRADAILENIISEHKMRMESTKCGESKEGEDLVDVVLRLQDHGGLQFPMTNDHIKAVLLVSLHYFYFLFFCYIHKLLFTSINYLFI